MSFWNKLKGLFSKGSSSDSAPPNDTPRDPRIPDHVSPEDAKEMAEMLANAERMVQDSRRRYEQAVDDYEAVHGTRVDPLGKAGGSSED
jgi:hypothetical protein